MRVVNFLSWLNAVVVTVMVLSLQLHFCGLLYHILKLIDVVGACIHMSTIQVTPNNKQLHLSAIMLSKNNISHQMLKATEAHIEYVGGFCLP